MSPLKKLLVILTVWAYALQAVAGVAAPCQHPAGPHESVLAAGPAGFHHDDDHVLPQAVQADDHDHDHAAGQPHSHAGDQAASDCDRCTQCDHGGCTCSDHSCSSTPGITSAGTLGVDAGPGVVPQVLSSLDLSQAFALGLIRPPSIS